MSTTLDLISTDIPHGSQAGFDHGCRGQGGCANHGSSEYLTCVEAVAARRQDWRLSKLPANRPIPRAAIALRSDRELTASSTPAASPPRPAAKRGPARSPRRKAATESKPPAAPSAAQPSPTRSTTRPAAARSARTTSGNGAGTRNAPSRSATTTPRRGRPRKAAGERVHGTPYGFQRGCKVHEECPNVAKGQPSCVEEHRRYHREYVAARKSGHGPAITHGTSTGYQMGCQDRDTCPGGADGQTCPDASLAAERRRARARGVPERRPLVASKPAREHIAELRDAGMTLIDIIEASGVGRTAIRTLVYGRDDYTPDGPGPRHRQIPERIDAEKARKILAVSCPARTAS